MNIALLTAAGTATRMHQDIPKQFIHAILFCAKKIWNNYCC